MLLTPSYVFDDGCLGISQIPLFWAEKQVSQTKLSIVHPSPFLLGPSFTLPFLAHTLLLASAPVSEKKNDKMLARPAEELSPCLVSPLPSLFLFVHSPSPGSSFLLFFPLSPFPPFVRPGLVLVCRLAWNLLALVNLLTQLSGYREPQQQVTRLFLKTCILAAQCYSG